MNQKYYGKYRGMVLNNIDPMQIGRLQVQVPDVAGLIPTSWAMPCFPSTGKQMGFWSIPQIGTGVWVEFEQGDPDYPIWSGCWFGSPAEVPGIAMLTQPPLSSFVLQTATQQTLQLSDLPGPTGGILLKSATGALISITDTTGITISDGKGGMINLFGGIVTINQGALLIK
jgi:uncharacterized protein involved in type VI secretion and phage assembly